MATVDETHDPELRSCVASANGHGEFPIQNLPFGIFSCDGFKSGCVAIGEEIVDLAALVQAGFLAPAVQEIARVAAGPTLNAFMAMGQDASAMIRIRQSLLLS